MQKKNGQWTVPIEPFCIVLFCFVLFCFTILLLWNHSYWSDAAVICAVKIVLYLLCTYDHKLFKPVVTISFDEALSTHPQCSEQWQTQLNILKYIYNRVFMDDRITSENDRPWYQDSRKTDLDHPCCWFTRWSRMLFSESRHEALGFESKMRVSHKWINYRGQSVSVCLYKCA